MTESYRIVMSFLPRLKKLKGDDYKTAYAVWFSCYQQTFEWKKKRIQVIDRDTWCYDCKCKPIEHIHHLSYKNLGSEPLEDLVGLCAECHRKRHGIDIKPENPEVIGSILKRMKLY